MHRSYFRSTHFLPASSFCPSSIQSVRVTPARLTGRYSALGPFSARQEDDTLPSYPPPIYHPVPALLRCNLLLQQNSTRHKRSFETSRMDKLIPKLGGLFGKYMQMSCHESVSRCPSPAPSGKIHHDNLVHF